MAWLMDNLGTILVSVVLVAIVVLIVRKQIRDRLAGRTSCGCGCENCASRGICHGNPAAQPSDPKDGKGA